MASVLQYAHLLGSTGAFHEQPAPLATQQIGVASSSPTSVASDAPRYFSEHEYDTTGYSSPPSSVPSSGHSSFVNPFQSFNSSSSMEYCSEASSYAGYDSSPLQNQGAQHHPQQQAMYAHPPPAAPVFHQTNNNNNNDMQRSLSSQQYQQFPVAPQFQTLPQQPQPQLQFSAQQQLATLLQQQQQTHSQSPQTQDPYGMQNGYYAKAYTAPRAGVIPGMSMDIGPSMSTAMNTTQGTSMDIRPGAKRRRTCPDISKSGSAASSVPATPSGSSQESPMVPVIRRGSAPVKEKRGAGKDGEDVWPTDVETAFFESVRLVPKLGRKKIVVNGKPCGRNELIGDYIRRKTGKLRSRKQVSSHIQVLKNLRKDDQEFIDLVAEPGPGEIEDDFTPEAHKAFFLPQEYAHVAAEFPKIRKPVKNPGDSLAPPVPSVSSNLSVNSVGSQNGLLSPYGENFQFSTSPSSAASSPMTSACSTRSVSPLPGSSAATPATEEMPITSQVFAMNLAPSDSLTDSLGLMSAMASPVGTQSSPSGSSSSSSSPVVKQDPDVKIEVPSGPIKGEDVNATPKSSPSKLGHRRVASRGLALTIPPNTFSFNFTVKQEEGQDQMASQHGIIPTIDAPEDFDGLLGGMLGGGRGGLNDGNVSGMLSNPHTPWPQLLHTPTCPPAAPMMLSSPSQRNRLTQIWASNSADWNKASPALEGSFQHELAAAVASSRNMQTAADRTTVPMKRSNTDIPLASSSSSSLNFSTDSLIDPACRSVGLVTTEDSDQFFSSLLGSREF